MIAVLLLLLLTAPPLLADSDPLPDDAIGFCAGSDYLAYSVRTAGQGARIGVVSLRGPLRGGSDQPLPSPLLQPTLSCTPGLAWLSSGDRRFSLRLTRGGEIEIESVSAQHEIEERATPAKTIACSSISSSGTPVSSIRKSLLRRWFEPSGRTIAGDDRFEIWRFADPSPSGGPTRLRVSIRERVSNRVDRHLVLLDTTCGF